VLNQPWVTQRTYGREFDPEFGVVESEVVVPDDATPASVCAFVEEAISAAQIKASWQFTTADACIKLRKLCPSLDS